MPGPKTCNCLTVLNAGLFLILNKGQITQRLQSAGRFCAPGLVLGLFLLLPQAHAQDDGSQPGATAGSSSEAGAESVLGERPFMAKVLGGADAEEGDWPSVVVLARPGMFALEDRLFCGATVVAERWVMTAAHCLYDGFNRILRPSSIRVVAGIQDLTTEPAAEETLVTNVIIHPEYDNSQSLPPNDIALLELATAVEAPPAKLFVGESEEYTGTMGFVAGWGATEYFDENNATYPTRLQDASVPLVSLATCNEPVSYQNGVTSRQMCAGFKEGMIDTCVGDSGGPLYIIEDGIELQVGITSFGNGCGLPNYYGIYTNVSHFIPWLGDYIEVPEQSAELIARREAGLPPKVDPPEEPAVPPPSNNKDSGLFGASAQPLLLVMIGAAGWIRHRRRIHRAASTPLLAVLALASLMLGSCSSSGNGPNDLNATVNDQANQDAAAMKTGNDELSSTDVQPLRLQLSTSGEGRPGLGALVLGAPRVEVLGALAVMGFTEPACDVEKTAMRGTGRLFMRETCVSSPRLEAQLQGSHIEHLNLHLLDEELIRFDVVMAGSEASIIGLSAKLDSTFAQHEKASDTSSWRSGEDHVRMHAPRSELTAVVVSSAAESRKLWLQMIDGRLEDKLPSLYTTP